MTSQDKPTPGSGDLAARLAALSPEKRALLERRLRGDDSAAASSRIARRADRADPPPLSFAQRRLWFLDQLEPGRAFYNLPICSTLSGAVDADALERALNEIVRRHESLRTSFVVEHGEPVQKIASELYVPLERVDIGPLPPDEREAEVTRRIAAESMRPFDLARGPLIRAQCIRLGEGDHRLLVTMHHIVSDGWSMTILYRELDSLYAAACAGRPLSLPDPELQYGDFAAWQCKALRGETLERLLSYWKRRLDRMPALLELPTDRPRPRVQTFEGGSYVVPYPREPLELLKAVARQEEATLFMALLAVMKVLLHRFSGVTDMVVGAPIANRNRIELEGIIGFFVNTLVLRTDLGGDPTFREVLRRVREVTLEAFAHQDLPFERLVEELQPDRNLSHNPLFQVMFALQNVELNLAPRNSRAQFAFGASKFDLTLSACETQEGLTGVFEFNSELFDATTIVSLSDAFGVLLGSAAAQPDRPISELALLGDDERRRRIAAAVTPGPAREPAVVHALFEQWAARTPAAIATVFGATSLTYAEADARANRLARALRESGAGPGAIIGLCTDRSPELLVGMLAILKAGAAFVSLDPAYPRDRLAWMLEETGAAILLTRASVRYSLPAFPGEIWALDADWPRIAAYPPEPVAAGIGPNDLAYVIYTSGSTGRPKGVMVPHRGAWNVAQAQIEIFQLPPGKRILQFASLGFDAAVFEVLLAAGSGGTLCFAPQEAILPGPPLLDTLRGQRIEAVVIPPSSLAVLPEAELPHLELLLAAGEALPRELVARWHRGRRFFNLYGPTETSIWATAKACGDDGDAPPALGPAIPNTAAYVLDADLEPLPPGFAGELVIGGTGVARGYLGRPAETAERYVPDPFGGAGARLFRTGDRARLRADGDIEFLGRFDQQVKLRGYRIELGEIETALAAHPAVREAAAVLQPTPGGEARIAAFCVPHDGELPQSADLRAHLRRRCPEFMMPAILQVIAALPLTRSGKVDRRALALRAESREERSTPRTPPRNEVEQTIAAVFREVLAADAIGAHDSFFDRGGHSLLATRATARIGEAYAIDLPLRAIFEFPTVAELAAEVGRVMRSAGAIPTAPPIARLPRLTVVTPAEQSR